MSANLNKPLIIYNQYVCWVAAVNMVFVVAGIWLTLQFASGLLRYFMIVFLVLFSLFWIRDLLFGFRLMLLSDGVRLRWQDGKTSGNLPLADIRKVLFGARTVQTGDSVVGFTFVRFALSSGAECVLPPNIASGLRANSWRRLKQLMAHIRTISNVPVEPINEPGVVLNGWDDKLE